MEERGFKVFEGGLGTANAPDTGSTEKSDGFRFDHLARPDEPRSKAIEARRLLGNDNFDFSDDVDDQYPKNLPHDNDEK